MTDYPLPPVQPDDTQPVATVAVAPLTAEQRDVLARASARPPGFVNSAHRLGSDRALCGTLVDLGLLAEITPGLFTITPAGRAAIAPQPGDGLPETPDVDRDMGVGPLVRDGSLFGVAPEDPATARVIMETIASDAHMALLADKAALLNERDQLARDLDDARTALSLKHDLYERILKSNSNLMTENRNLRETLDKVRRDLRESEARQRSAPPSPDVLALLEKLTTRVDELEALLDEPVPYTLADAVERLSRVEVWTLNQNIASSGARKEADDQLAAALNAGWTALHIGLDTGLTEGGSAWTYRIVTLTREIVEDATGPDPKAEAATPLTVPGVDMIPVVGHALAAPGEVVAYANHAPMIVSAEPLISLQV